MSCRDTLKQLIAELDYRHSNRYELSPENFELPDFVTARNGNTRSFTRKAREYLRDLSKTLHENDYASVIKLDEFEKVVRQVVANLHAEGIFFNYDVTNKEPFKMLKSDIAEEMNYRLRKYTHYFPAWTLGIEYANKAPFELGPVTQMTRSQWLDSVDFSDETKSQLFSNQSDGFDWKEELKESWGDPEKIKSLDMAIKSIHSATKDCPSVLKAEVDGLEYNLSRKLARQVCKTALDSISLAYSDRSRFFQQSLHDERLPPRGISKLAETNGFLALPGMSLTKRIPDLPEDMILTRLNDIQGFLPAIENILSGQLQPNEHMHPQLCNRWAVALNWYAEGQRENNDAVALAKIATSLDVLSNGGRKDGILDMLLNLFTIEEANAGDRQKMDQLVKQIYNDGRSKILHGNMNDHLADLDIELNQASYFAKNALIICADRLRNYNGKDSDNAFRTI
jgi:hypothetical protein